MPHYSSELRIISLWPFCAVYRALENAPIIFSVKKHL